jgi:hypothetical protein
MEIKRFKDWEGNLDEYLQVGDLVDDDMYWYFVNVLPPASMNSYIVQIGEPNDHIDGRATYATLKYTPAGWMWVGHCFRGETEEVRR